MEKKPFVACRIRWVDQGALGDPTTNQNLYDT